MENKKIKVDYYNGFNDYYGTERYDSLEDFLKEVFKKNKDYPTYPHYELHEKRFEIKTDPYIHYEMWINEEQHFYLLVNLPKFKTMLK